MEPMKQQLATENGTGEAAVWETTNANEMPSFDDTAFERDPQVDTGAAHVIRETKKAINFR
jgi:hypothetical protein